MIRAARANCAWNRAKGKRQPTPAQRRGLRGSTRLNCPYGLFLHSVRPRESDATEDGPATFDLCQSDSRLTGCQSFVARVSRFAERSVAGRLKNLAGPNKPPGMDGCIASASSGRSGRRSGANFRVFHSGLGRFSPRRLREGWWMTGPAQLQRDLQTLAESIRLNRINMHQWTREEVLGVLENTTWCLTELSRLQVGLIRIQAKGMQE